MMKLNGIIEALGKGYSLGCWASAGGVPIVAIMVKYEKTVAYGEGKIIKESFLEANSNWFKYQRKKVSYKEKNQKLSMPRSGIDKNDLSILGVLDHYVKSGVYLQVDFNSYSNIYIVMIDGYDDNLNKVIQLGFNKDLIKAIEITLNMPKQLLNEQ